MALAAEQKPEEIRGNVAWVQLMKQMILSWSRERKYKHSSATANRDFSTSSTWKQPRKYCWVSMSVLSLRTAQLFECYSFKYGKMCISAHPAPCTPLCVCEWLHIHPAQSPTPLEQYFCLSTYPFLAVSTHHCTPQGLIQCSPGSCSAKANNFSCCGIKENKNCSVRSLLYF